MKLSCSSITLLSLLTITSQVFACTGITLKTKDGSVISSRTMEFGLPLDSKVIFLPRNFKTDVVFADGKKGASWKQKYSILGINGLNQNLIAEGFNEKGLNVGAFYLPGYAVYNKLTSDNASKAVSSIHFPLWIAGNFATVEEVKNGLKDIVVVDSAAQGINMALPLHYRVTDSTGAEIIIEYVKDGLKIYDATFGVITNSPEYSWHLTNIANYNNLSATNVSMADLPGLKLLNTSQGTGMHGLPGDFTPPSRFIRILAIQQSALPVDTAEEGVNLAWHIINNVDIPIGVTRDKDDNGTDFFNRTQWVNVTDLKNAKIYLRTYDNQTIRVIDMNKIGMDSTGVKTIPINVKPEYLDISTVTN